VRINHLIALLITLPLWLRSAPDTLYLDATTQTLESGSVFLGQANQSVNEINPNNFQNIDFQKITADTTTDFYLHWVVKNTIGWDNTWLFEYKDRWHQIEIYSLENGTWQLSNRSGPYVPFDKKVHFQRAKNYLPIALKNGAAKEILIHLSYDLSNQFYIPQDKLEGGTISLKETLKDRDVNVRKAINIFLGVFLIMFFYNFLLYIHTGDKNYLLYLFIIVGASIAQEANFQFLGVQFTNHNTYLKVVPWIATAFHAAIALFTRGFLQVKQHYPHWDKVLTALLILFLLTPIPAMLGYMKPSYLLIAISRILLILTVLIIGVKSYKKQIPGSVYFLLGQIFFFLSFLITPLFLLNIIPIQEWALYIPNLGSASLIVFFSVALGDRINALRKENEDKQLQIIQSERKNTLLERERVEELKEINASITRFVPYQFIRALQKENITDVKLGDYVQRKVSVLFSDIRGYTTIAESMTPEENFRFVVNYSKRMGPIIEQNKGFISQYLGDGIMSLFLHRSDDAVQAAIHMLQTMHLFNAKRMADKLVPIKTGIGLETGSLIMGIIGHSNRTDPATISDTVNVSARLEGLTKFFKVSLIVGETAFNSLENPTGFQHRYLGKILLKGKKLAIDIYDFFDGDTAEIKQLKLDTKPDFDIAIGFYLKGDIGNARRFFEKVFKAHPSDQVTIHYLKKCSVLLEKGMPADWSPVEVMTEK